MQTPKRPRDINQLSKTIVDLAIGKIQEPQSPKNPHAVEPGRLGRLKGGKARAKALSVTQRSKIAHAGARARWGKKPRIA